ncbi:hypothetical protein Pcinc_028551 [Petrolisthes cinctipes]|uniref:Uncharacterized protein n=1 Tax=Petrolisthes cinctipes TaxID=88211 RepID=A0AAE1K583_PETCI|nr:hypothetical protein Pcinc_028551 [Petrolisthes cinctipes]
MKVEEETKERNEGWREVGIVVRGKKWKRKDNGEAERRQVWADEEAVRKATVHDGGEDDDSLGPVAGWQIEGVEVEMNGVRGR